MVKELRDRTGVGVMDCKKALCEAMGNIEEAIKILRTKGKAKAREKSLKQALQGAITSYIHPGGRVGVLLEVNCETDFVARTPLFKEISKNLAMQIAAANPLYISKEDIPEEVLEKEKEIYREEARASGKPERVIQKIVEGKLKKYFEEVCLLEQPYIREEKRKVKDILQEGIAKLGENLIVRRFTRYEIGGK
jgi:elongation factor Ts